jgi:ferredoxin-NADP reductase
VLIAGGIGITPFMAQLEDLHQRPRALRAALLCALPGARGVPAAAARARGRRVHVYYDSEGQAIDFDRLLSDQPLGTHVYVCGPAGMINRM